MPGALRSLQKAELAASGNGLSAARNPKLAVDVAHMYLDRLGREVQPGLETRIYQIEARHETFAQPLNVVAIVKRQQATGKHANVYLIGSGNADDQRVQSTPLHSTPLHFYCNLIGFNTHNHAIAGSWLICTK
jgi:hypothetical protein